MSKCNECGGEHAPSGARIDCINYWKERAFRLENALSKIRNYPVHSEPVGGAYAMQDIALAAIENK